MTNESREFNWKIQQHKNCVSLQKHDFTSVAQPLDAGITKKVKYGQKVMRYVLARIADDRNGYEIANEIDVIHAIEWITNAQKEVSKDNIKSCFAKCIVVEQPARIVGDEDVDEEFNSVSGELSEELQMMVTLLLTDTITSIPTLAHHFHS